MILQVAAITHRLPGAARLNTGRLTLSLAESICFRAAIKPASPLEAQRLCTLPANEFAVHQSLPVDRNGALEAGATSKCKTSIDGGYFTGSGYDVPCYGVCTEQSKIAGALFLAVVMSTKPK